MNLPGNRPLYRPKAAAALATIAIGLFGYFIAALLLLHALRPDYTVVDHMISDYAVGRFRWIMSSAFVALAFGCLASGIGLGLAGPRGWLGRIAAALLVVVFAGLIVTAIFPTDLETAPSTRTGDIHALSFLINVAASLLAAICFGLGCRGTPYWRSRRAPALSLALLLIAAFVAQFLTLHRGAPYGITNRLFVAILLAWLATVSIWLKRAPVPAQSAG